MKRIVFAATLAAAALPFAAQANTPSIDPREAGQQSRIEQGAQSGQLTPKEAARLENGHAKVQKMEAKAKADGTVTAKERKKIRRAQDKQSRKIYKQIYKQKHDNPAAPKA